MRNGRVYANAGRLAPSLRGRVVVITGASSGIGRATARAFADCGARLVLAARNEDALHDVVGECARRGAHAIVQPTDVTDAKAMEELARVTEETFGGIDVWINNAGVGLFGPFTHADMELHRRVVETNLFGTMNGAAAVLPYFMEQGRGIMITNISVGAFAPVPYAAAYTAGKFGLRGFMAALRQEFADRPGIRLCSVFPAIIDTPGFAHGANVSGARMRPKWMVFPPEKVAAAMVNLAMRPRAEVCVGWPSRLAKAGYGVAPMAVECATGTAFRAYLRRADAAGRTTGNLFSPSKGPMQPSGGLRIDGNGFRDNGSGHERRMRSLAWAGIAGGGAALIAVRLLAGGKRTSGEAENSTDRRRTAIRGKGKLSEPATESAHFLRT